MRSDRTKFEQQRKVLEPFLGCRSVLSLGACLEENVKLHPIHLSGTRAFGKGNITNHQEQQ